MKSPLGTKRRRTREALLVAVAATLLDPSTEGISVPAVTRRAGVAHGTFYNYFDSMDEALDALGLVLVTEHARLIERTASGVEDPAEVFAVSTRQTLRLILDVPDYGRLWFDSGLSVDRLTSGLATGLNLDVTRGIAEGQFHTVDVELIVSLIAGAVTGLALDLHRQRLGATAIDEGTEQLLLLLGVDPATARRLAHAPHEFVVAETPAIMRGAQSELVEAAP